jgi:hypothetical protein
MRRDNMELKNYEIAIGMNDYKVNLKVDNQYNVLSIIAAEDIKEGRKKFATGQEVKLSKSDIKFLEENLREEFIPFSEDEEEE